MIHRLFHSIIILLIGCGTNNPPDYTTKYGSEVYELKYKNWSNKEQADYIQDFLINTTNYNNQKSKECFKKLIIQLTDHCWNDTTPPCTGETYMAQNAILIVAEGFQCPYHSAWAHESFHYLRSCILNDPDYNHLDPLWPDMDHLLIECPNL